MMGHASKEILFFFLVTCIYMTCGILMTSPTKLPSIVHSYLPPRSVPVSMRSSSSSIVYANHKYDVVDEPEEIPGKGRGGHHFEASYLYPSSRPITVSLPFKDEIVQTFDKAEKIVRTLNGDSYNNELHPPTNPVLALLLSRYGKYVSGLRNPRLYSYMAVNNIHNNRPFGQYKQECEEEPR
ncbi:PREDICTED: uncharacterized protein LOC106789315 [Polistes canadensis]|uniref:uncharacterized protein LOC106789315 n=1 Tax=Polistes canadensis TaxID=91411 RepID=UPI000718B50F|nr:PREDICTED: uncharacterized protein LOC106789315 [Polistes canadensis]